MFTEKNSFSFITRFIIYNLLQFKSSIYKSLFQLPGVAGIGGLSGVVGVAGEDDVEAAGGEKRAEAEGEAEVDVFFEEGVGDAGAGVEAAVGGVEEDGGAVEGDGRGRGGRRRSCRGSGGGLGVEGCEGEKEVDG